MSSSRNVVDVPRVVVSAGVELHDRGHPLTPPVVLQTDDDRVHDRGVLLEDGLDLLGIHLLPARVDAQRPPTEQVDGAVRVDRRHVAGNE